MSLRSGLQGAWNLGSYVENPVDGSPSRYPFGDDARGRLIYDHEGWMSVQLMVRQQPVERTEISRNHRLAAAGFKAECLGFWIASGSPNYPVHLCLPERRR